MGTLRKTLILHFECVHTGLEFPIVSHEWSKWLKIGFSLVKAGQAIIDVGTGNPLGILKKGVECVQEIYSAYKTNDDDEFNTYITQPFLTSKEQDMLLEKLRDQSFFDVFAYDAQVPGWYLLHPEKDGKTACGDAGSVNKMHTKEGYGIGETITAIAKEAVGAFAGDASGLLNPLIGAAVEVELATPGTTSSTGDSPIDAKQGKKPASAGSGGASGGRAAAMREQFGNSVNAQADAKLEMASKDAFYYDKVDDMEKKFRELDDKVKALTADVHELRNKTNSSCCVIS
ncbi:hypothetical protein EON65_37170 [archaeon]|nr:MAG: hypothetical protein EON65_37170 [archaeon]